MKKEIRRSKSANPPYEDGYVYVFEEHEMYEIVPLIERAVKKKISTLQNKVDHYEGLKETCASERQLDMLFYYCEKLEFFKDVLKFTEKNRNILPF